MPTELDSRRKLPWDACYNARDLGGYQTADGKETRWRTIIRTDNLSRLTEAGRAALVEYGVRTVIDVRAPRELAIDPPPFAEAGSHGVTHRNVPFIGDDAPPAPQIASLGDDYISMLARFRREVGAIMTAIAQAPEGGVVIHCHSGKDRTGLVVALLLDLVQVPAETIAADYALSKEYLEPVTREWMENGTGDRAERERELAFFTTDAATMLKVLAEVHEQYGGAEPYLLGAGVEPEDIERLRKQLAG